MKKENIIGILLYILVFAVALIYGFTVLQAHFSRSSFADMTNPVLMYAVYILVSVVGGVFVTGVLQEFGHFLGAKTGGYKILSICLFYFTFYRNKEGKIRFKFASFDGLTGETKITPNYEKREKPNPYPFLLYGTIFNVAWIIACLVMFFRDYKVKGINGDISYFFLTMGIIAALATIFNILPIKVDSETDGYNLSKIKGDVAAFNQYLEFESGGETSNKANVVKKEQPAKFVPEIALSDVSALLEKDEYEKAFELIAKIKEHEDELNKKYQLELKAQYIYTYIFSKSETEVVEFYEKEVSYELRKDLANDNQMTSIRTYILTAGILDGSKSEVMLSLSKVLKAYKAVPNNRKHSELILFNKALDKVIEYRPKWEELPNYKLYE